MISRKLAAVRLVKPLAKQGHLCKLSLTKSFIADIAPATALGVTGPRPDLKQGLDLLSQLILRPTYSFLFPLMMTPQVC